MYVVFLHHRAHKDLIDKGQLERNKAKERQKVNLVALQKQIREKEEARIQDLRDKYEEGIQMDNERKERREKLEEYKFEKFRELKYVY